MKLIFVEKSYIIEYNIVGWLYMKKMIIIGAGISGVYLSILLKNKYKEFIDVIVLEQNASPLKKLLATGNGRCNLSNRNMCIDFYQSDNQELVKHLINDFDMVDEMNKLGIMTKYQGELLYPRSEQALTIKNVMMDKAIEAGVVFIYNQNVNRIKIKEDIIVTTDENTYHADYLTFAMGSEAGKLSGVSSNRYDMLEKLGLSVLPRIPSLVQFKTKPVLKDLKGVRVKGKFKLLEDNKCVHEETGELLFTDYGVSGISVMQLSSYYKAGKHYQISMDFFEDICHMDLKNYIEERMEGHYNHIYDGMLHNKIAHFIEKKDLKDSDKIVKYLKDFRLDVVDLCSYETAQVMKGGLSLKEVDSNLALNKYPNMFAIGEILNVVGMCGGYNIHFALSCAKRVANAIEVNENVKNTKY